MHTSNNNYNVIGIQQINRVDAHNYVSVDTVVS
jgi:hypothetical protein